MGAFDFVKRWFTVPGSSGVRANQQRQEQVTMLQQQWAEIDRLRAQGFQAEAHNLEVQLRPFQNALLQSLGLPVPTPGTVEGGRLSPEDYAAFEKMWSVPGAEWFNARGEPGLQEQINPFLNIPGIQEDVYSANLATSEQTLADEYADLVGGYKANLGERGMTGASFAPGGLGALSILRGQQGARNRAGAIAARENIGASLRGEQREGATTWSDMLRRSIIDKITAQAAQRGETLQSYLTRYGLLGSERDRLTALGDTSGSIGNLANVGSSYGNIAQNYLQLGQNAMAPLYSLMGAAGTYFGGRAGRSQQQPGAPSGPTPNWTPGPLPNYNPTASYPWRPYTLGGGGGLGNQGLPKYKPFGDYGW